MATHFCGPHRGLVPPIFLLFAAVALRSTILVASAEFTNPIAVPNAANVEVDGHRWFNLLTAYPRSGSGGALLNAFGLAFNSTPQWSVLCPLDSDGDGFTNGEELGDPNCTWTPSGGARTAQLSHPGLFGSIPIEAYPSRTRAARVCLRDISTNGTSGDRRLFDRVNVSAPLIPLLTTFARVVAVRKAGPDVHLPAEDRSTCPHLASGLSDWHDPSTWGAAGVPTAGSAVTIPANKRVLVSSCSLEPAGYAKITIPAGTALVFADAPIFLRVKDMLVEGELLLGGKACPLHSAVSITFTGEKAELATYSNGIMATGGGAVRLHGTRNEWTWTRLAATVVPGTVYVFVQDAVGWGPGDEIVITTSIWRDLENDQNEVRTVVAVDVSGKILVVDRAFSFKHYASVEYQTEVGLLSRSIILRGSPSVQSTRDRFGGHTMAVGPTAVLEVIGVRAQRMGQQNILGRYPFHMHLQREGGAFSTLQQSTCDGCWYRCISVHKSNGTLVRKNVAFNVSGHTFYLEDGGEMFNRIEYNLAAYIMPIGAPAGGGSQIGTTFVEDSTAIQPADHTASGFYIANPHNYVVGNAASGGWSGFSYPIFPNPMRLSADLAIVPSKLPILEFDGNTAHSSGYYWEDAGCIYFGGKLTDNAAGTLFTYTNGRFSHPTKGFHNVTNLRVWLCQRGFSSWGDRVEIDRYEAHDVKRSAVLFGSSSIHNAIMTGTTDNNPPDMRGAGRQGFGFYDVAVQTVLANITFVNYWPRSTTALWERDCVIADLAFSDVFKPWGISATRDIKLENVDTTNTLARWIHESGSSRMFNIADWDGSLLQSPTCAPHIIGSEIDWWNVGSDCLYRSDWPAYVCPRVPGREVVGLDIDLPGILQKLDERTNGDDELTQEQRDRLYIGHISQWGNKSSRKLIITRNTHLATGLSGIGWYMYLSTGVPQVIKITPKNFPTNGVYIALAIPYPAGTTFDIWVVPVSGTLRTRFEEVSTRSQVINGNGTSYAFVASEGLLYLKIGDWWTAYPNSYRRYGVDVYSVMPSDVQVVVNASCPSRNAAGFCVAPASPNPPNNDEGPLPVRVCGSPTEQTRKQVPTDLCPTFTDTLRPDLVASTPDCNTYVGTTTSRCPALVSAGYCNATCAAACRVFNPYPYRCSFAEPCQTREFRKPALDGQCSALVDRPHTLHKDTCFVKACVEGRLTQLRSPSGTPCDGEADMDSGAQFRCNDAARCVNASFYAAGVPSVRRVTDRTTAGVNNHVVEVLVDGAGQTIRSVTALLGGGAGAGAPPLTAYPMQPADTPKSGAWLYRYVHGSPVRRNVTILLTTTTLGSLNQTRSFSFLDWARTAQLVPRISPTVASGQTAVGVQVTLQIEPIDWVARAVLFPSATAGNVSMDLVCDAGLASACALPLTSTAQHALGADAHVVLHLLSNITVRRALPCLSTALHANARCETPTVTVRRPHVPCQHTLVFSGHRYWYSLTLVEGSVSSIAAIIAPSNRSLVRNAGTSTFAGAANGQTTPATIVIILRDGRNETHVLERPGTAVAGDEVVCRSGFAVPPPAREVGLPGYCVASTPHVCDINASPPPPLTTTTMAAATPSSTTGGPMSATVGPVSAFTSTKQNTTTPSTSQAKTTLTTTTATTSPSPPPAATTIPSTSTTTTTAMAATAPTPTTIPSTAITTTTIDASSSSQGPTTTRTASTTTTTVPTTTTTTTVITVTTVTTTIISPQQNYTAMVIVLAEGVTSETALAALAAHLGINPSRLQVVRPATGADLASIGGGVNVSRAAPAVVVTVSGDDAAVHVMTAISMTQEALLALGLLLAGAAPTAPSATGGPAANGGSSAPLPVILGVVGAVVVGVVALVAIGVHRYARSKNGAVVASSHFHACGIVGDEGAANDVFEQPHNIAHTRPFDTFPASSQPVLLLQA